MMAERTTNDEHTQKKIAPLQRTHTQNSQFSLRSTYLPQFYFRLHDYPLSDLAIYCDRPPQNPSIPWLKNEDHLAQALKTELLKPLNHSGVCEIGTAFLYGVSSVWALLLLPSLLLLFAFASLCYRGELFCVFSFVTTNARMCVQYMLCACLCVCLCMRPSNSLSVWLCGCVYGRTWTHTCIRTSNECEWKKRTRGTLIQGTCVCVCVVVRFVWKLTLGSY